MEVHIGDKIGRLTVIEYGGYKQYAKRIENLWKCKCECGNEKIVSETTLKRNANASCGCYKREKVSKSLMKHSFTKHPLYKIWRGIKTRCFNSNSKSYERYGGRGITMCNEWSNNAASFCQWSLDNGYKKGLSIDRIDNDGNYEPNNCRWVDKFVQANNKRNNHKVLYNGEIYSLNELERLTGLDHRLIGNRLERGWDIEKIISTPTEKGRNQYGEKYTTETFIKRAKEVHGDTYIYDDVVYSGCDNPIYVICPKHGKFKTTPYRHVNRKQKCRQCAIEKRKKKCNNIKFT